MNTKTGRSESICLFLIGLFSLTQLKLGAKIGISELVCCCVAPFLFLKNMHILRRDGAMPFFMLLILWIFGALFSDWWNKSFFEQVIRGFSVPVTLFSVSVCVYLPLRKDPLALKWMLLGLAISSVLTIFVFQRGTAGDLAAEGQTAEAIDAVVGYKLFWTNMIKTWLSLPIQGWYMSTGSIYLIPALAVIAVSNMISGGRSMFAMTIFTIFLVFAGGKTAQSMTRMKRHIPFVVVGVAGLMFLVKGAYSYAAKNGMLDEYETKKYERQTARGSGFMALLKSGRGEFFIGLDAALDKPFVGHGSQPFDTHGYVGDYLREYGTDFERESYMRNVAKGALAIIPSHSHIINYWMNHGITALLFWLYVLYLTIQTFRKRLAIIPEWFGYWALTMPLFLWDFFFSPLGLRVHECVMYCAMLVLMKIERERRFRRQW